MDNDDNTPSIEWGAPPTPKAGRKLPKYDRIVDQLKQRPGEWAKVLTDANYGMTATFTKRGCETTTRSTGNKRCDVYARWPETDTNQKATS